MASSPINGDSSSSPRGVFRRSSSQFATLPQRSLSFHEKAGLAKGDAAAEVLYSHQNVRIYKFQPPTDALQSHDTSKKTLPDADYPIDAIEVLPWRARTETLSAKGKLIIEKVQGSVHFLKAGDLIHTIMKNSQCWCVDGESKFVMRVGKLRYQRIEFPTTEADEKEKVEEFKNVISKILKFEKTPCPFIRAFHVGLPEDAITPRRRGPWKRRESLTPVTPLTPDDEPQLTRRTKGPRTLSMRGLPPNSFPSKSMTQLDPDRPRTVSTPIASGRSSFPDVRIESPTNYTSGEDTDSELHDSGPERPESNQAFDREDVDRESRTIPIIKSPLKHIQTIPSSQDTSTQSEASTSKTISPSYQQTRSREPVPEDVTVQEEPSVPTTHVDEHCNHTATEDLQSDPPVSATGGDLVVAPVEWLEPSVTVPEETEIHPIERDVPVMAVQTDILSTVDGGHHEQAMNEQQVPPQTSDVPAGAATEATNFSIRDSAAMLISEPVDSSADNSTTIAPEDATTAQTVSHASSTPQDHTSGPLEHMSAVSIGSEFAGSNSVALEMPVSEDPEVNLRRTHTNDDNESMMSSDSFHTLLSDDEDYDARPSSFPGQPSTRLIQHRREVSEMTIRAGSVDYDDSEDHSLSSSLPAAASKLVDGAIADATYSWPDLQLPGTFRDGPELRQRRNNGRSLSPSPPESILQRAPRGGSRSPMPRVLLQKAATLAVVKPIEVLLFVVHVLGRIAHGATMHDLVNGDLFKRPDTRRTASGTFEQGMRGRALARKVEDEDDYGVPVHYRGKSTNQSSLERPAIGRARTSDDAASFASID